MPETRTDDSTSLNHPTAAGSLTLLQDAYIDFDEHASAPGTPNSGNVRMYARQDGRLYQKDDAGEENELAMVDILPLRSGRYYLGLIHSGQQATATLAANALRAAPLFVPRRTTFDRISIEVATAVGGTNIRLGVYADSAGVPGSLVLDAGTVSSATTGVKEITISQTLERGWYWLALVSDGTPSIQTSRLTGGTWPMLGFTGVASANPPGQVSRSFTYAALPNPFGGTLTYENTTIDRVFLRVA